MTRTAFVASTLPAIFIKTHHVRLGIRKVVCASRTLRESFSFLEKDGLEIHVVTEEKLLEKELLTTGEIVTFHECCWLSLDLAILKLQPIVHHYPCVTLSSFRKLAPQELSTLSLFLRCLKKPSAATGKFFLRALALRENFDFYEFPEDNASNKMNVVFSLRPKSIKNLTHSFQCLEERSKLSDASPEQAISKNIILVAATDIVENLRQRAVFQEVARICQQCGFEVFVKDHPNPSARLNLKIGKEISPLLPFEVIDEPYRYKIGLFSTTLIFQPQLSISIANLFDPVPESFESRKAHLLSIPGGEKIKFIKDLNELEQLLSSEIGKNPPS
jgi:hypothetical protein